MTTVQETGGPRARLTDPVGSHLAAEGSNITDSRLAVLRMLANRPRTDEEIAWDWRLLVVRCGESNYSPSRLRTARFELVRLGLVTDTGREGRTSSGRRCGVWAITIQGLEALE